MIRFFRKYQKTVFGILVFMLGALLISSFGVDLYHRQNSQNDAAITVNGEKISKEEFYQKKRSIESQYRKMFGAQYDKIAKQFGMSIPQTVVDGLIENSLIKQEATKLGLAAPDSEIAQKVSKEFPQGYNPKALEAAGITPAEFLSDLSSSVIQDQIDSLINLASIPTQEEIKKAFAEQEGSFDIEYRSFNPSDFEKSVKTSTDDELKAFYEDRKNDYKTKAAVSYQYISFDPEKFYDQIETPQEEVEFYYTENQKEFEIPESLKIRHIQILTPKNASAEKLVEIKKTAEEALSKAKSNVDFSELVSKYSDDLTSKLKGGDIGWVPRGRYSKAYDEKAYAVKDGGISQLIQTDYGFYIVKVEGHKDSSIKNLDEVKDQIIKKLKDEQAPAIADAAAREFYDNFLAANESLEEFIKGKNLTIKKTNGLVTSDIEALDAPKGTTVKVMGSLPETKQFIEDKKTSYVVEVLDQKESVVPDLASIKDKVILDWNKNESIKLSKNSADEFLKSIKEGKPFTNSTKITGFKKDDIKSILSGSSELVQELTSSTSFPSVASSAYFIKDSYYVAKVASKSVPDFTTAAEDKIKQAKNTAKQQLTENVKKQFIENLKKKSKIDVNPSILQVSIES